MAGVLQHLRSSTLNKRPNPASMVDGQIAINYASGSPGAFFKDSNGNLVKVGPVHVGATAPNVSPASGGTAGNSLGEQWLDTSGGTYVFKIWDGATWRSEAGEFVNVTGDTMTGSLTMGPSANLIFEGSTDDGFETTLTVVDPTADRTITLPNISGTVVTTGDSGTVTSTMIADGTIVNGDVSASAAIAGTKISPDFGSQTIQTSGIFSHALGSQGAPTITFAGDTDTGIYSPGANQVAITTSGNSRLFVDASGNVGIGTTSATESLHVAGNARFGAADANTAYLEIGQGATGNRAAFIDLTGDTTYTDYGLRVTRENGGANGDSAIAHRGTGSLRLESVDSGSVSFKIGGSEAGRFDSSRRLLVGTSSANQYNHYSNAIRYQQVGTDATSASAQYTIFENSANGPGLLLGKSRSGTQGTNTVVQNSDALGAFIFLGADGTNWLRAAQIEAQVDGTPGAGDMPGRLVFSTTPDNQTPFTGPVERMRITSGGYFKATSNNAYTNVSGLFHEVYSANASEPVLLATATSNSYTGQGYDIRANRAASNLYAFFRALSSNGGSVDNEFVLYGDGNGNCDGAWTGGGADYAEYFEWSDSNPDAEDRRGISAVLDGDKIREAVAGEDPIGVISGNPSVVGDAAWNKWSGKYLRDEYGTYIQEDYEVEDEDGNTVIQQRRKLNPAYDPEVEYVSRENRPEWDCVGLMGKLRIRKGQVTGSRWIKMRDINDSVEEWLVR